MTPFPKQEFQMGEFRRCDPTKVLNSKSNCECRIVADAKQVQGLEIEDC